LKSRFSAEVQKRNKEGNEQKNGSIVQQTLPTRQKKEKKKK